MAINMSSVSGATSTLTRSIVEFNFSEFISSLKPLLFFIIGITIYSVFVYKFYKFLARRDIIKLPRSKIHEGAMHKLWRTIYYILENLILIPLLVFFWFSVLAILLLLLTKNPELGNVLLISASLVAVVRITSYYSENLSQDLAKMIPFTLLGVFLLDVSYFSLDASVSAATQIIDIVHYLLYYLLFVSGLELVLRIVNLITSSVITKSTEIEE